MHSDFPKVLQPLAGRPLLSHVLATARALQPRRVVIVVGHGGDAVRSAIGEADVDWVTQEPQLGTGHALMQALPRLARDGVVLVLYGDVPLIEAPTLAPLARSAACDRLALLVQHLENPRGYGRILRDGAGRITGIVEEKDASVAERAIRETNTGIMAAPSRRLEAWLARHRSTPTEATVHQAVTRASVRDLPGASRYVS